MHCPQAILRVIPRKSVDTGLVRPVMPTAQGLVRPVMPAKGDAMSDTYRIAVFVVRPIMPTDVSCSREEDRSASNACTTRTLSTGQRGRRTLCEHRPGETKNR